MTEIRGLSDDEFVMLEALKEARAQEKEWKAQSERCRAALLDSLGDALVVLDPVENPTLQLSYPGIEVVGEIKKRTSRGWNRKLFAKDWAALDANPDYHTVSESTIVSIFGETEQ